LLYAEDRARGWGEESKPRVLDFAFGLMGMHGVKGTMDPPNVRGGRGVEKAGYPRAGVLTADVPLGLGTYADTLVYQLLASDWRKQD